MDDSINQELAATKSEINVLNKKTESLQQELYETKRRLATADMMKEEMEREIGDLNGVIKESLSNALKQTADSDLVDQLKRKAKILQCDLDDERLHKIQLETENVMLKEKLALSEMNTSMKDDKIRQDQLEHSLISFQERCDRLEVQLDEKELLIMSLMDEKQTLIRNLAVTEDRLEEISNILTAKGEAFQSTLETLKSCQEEKAMVQCELSALKAGPVGMIGRGNSLFAEVEDKRQQMAEVMQSLRSKYAGAKKLLALYKIENAKLKNESLRFSQHLKESEKAGQIEEICLLQSYEARIEDLMAMVRNLECRPESPQVVTISEHDLSKLQFINTLVENARSESRELRAELSKKSVCRVLEAERLFQTQKELHSYKAQAVKNETMIDQLKADIAMLKIEKDPITTLPTMVEEDNKPAAEEPVEACQRKTVRMAEDVKDNEYLGVNKKAQLRRVPKPLTFPRVQIPPSTNEENKAKFTSTTNDEKENIPVQNSNLC